MRRRRRQDYAKESMVVRNWWKDSCKIGYQVRHHCEQSFAERIVLRILTDDLNVTDEPALIYFQ